MTSTLTLIIVGIPFFLVTVYLTRRFWTAAGYRSRIEYMKNLAGFRKAEDEQVNLEK